MSINIEELEWIIQAENKYNRELDLDEYRKAFEIVNNVGYHNEEAVLYFVEEARIECTHVNFIESYCGEHKGYEDFILLQLQNMSHDVDILMKMVVIDFDATWDQIWGNDHYTLGENDEFYFRSI